MTQATAAEVPTGHRFHHEALMYADVEEFLAGTAPFVEAGLDAGEAVMVALSPDGIAALRDRLGPREREVRFADMRQLGRNPARIIPAWRDFVEANLSSGRGMRGIGEPVWPGRTPAEIDECHVHECLLNVAFDGGPAWSLLCPYDAARLDPDVVGAAHRTHRHVTASGQASSPGSYRPPANPFDRPLATVPAHAASLPVGVVPLAGVRAFVAEEAVRCGLPAERAQDLVLAVCEVAANTVRHGAGHGVLRLWRDAGSVICDLEEPTGSVRFDPLVGRARPSTNQSGGRGLWIANQLCDLVQLHAGDRTTSVRIHLHLG